MKFIPGRSSKYLKLLSKYGILVVGQDSDDDGLLDGEEILVETDKNDYITDNGGSRDENENLMTTGSYLTDIRPYLKVSTEVSLRVDL